MLGRSVQEKIGCELAEGYCGEGVHALGLVGIDERGLEDAIYRLKYSNDSHEFEATCKAVAGIAKTRGIRQSWRWRDYPALAKAVVLFWIADICPACTGIGKQRLEDAPILDDGCPECNGTGKRPYPWAGEAGERYFTETLYMLQKAEQRIRLKLVTRLSHEIRESGVLEPA